MTYILCCVTSSPNLHRVVRAANLLGRAMRRPVRFAHFGDADEGASDLDEVIRREAGAEARVERLEAKPRVGEAIIRFARQSSPDLVVMGAAARDRALQDLAGSTARRVALEAPCAVLLVSTVGRPPENWSRFLASMDDGPAANWLGSLVLDIARIAGSDSSVCFVHEEMEFGTESGPDEGQGGEPLSIAEQLESRRRLASFVDGVDTHGVEVTATALRGRPGQEIARYASDSRADLLGVIAPAHRLGVISRVFSHPIVMVLDHLACSVLVFRGKPAVEPRG